MRAAVMTGDTIRIEHVPDPTPMTGQVVIAPHATGICGSDLHFRQLMSDVAALEPSASPAVVPGHEFAGEVVAIGPRTATELTEGQLVTAIPFTAGANGPETIGLSPTFPGGLAELTAVDAARVFPLPQGVNGRLGALTEPLAVAVHAFGRAAPAGPIVVVGAGPIGLGIIAVAAFNRRHPIISIEPSERRRSMALRLGADAAYEPGTELTGLLAESGYEPDTISPLLDHDPVSSTIFECVGVAAVVQSLVAAAPPHSRVVLTGACPHSIDVSPLQLTLAEATIDTSFAYRPHDFVTAIEQLAVRPDLFAELITSDHPLEHTEAAFAALSDEPDEIKVLIDPRR